MDVLPRDFYLQDTLTVAKDLLGKLIVHIDKGSRLSGMIVETEAYLGEQDDACHASKGRTKRTEVMYQLGGHAYIYLIYGMYELFNVVTRHEGYPEAVLIRAVEPIDGIDQMTENYKHSLSSLKLTNGPGKFTKAMNITRSLNCNDLTTKPLFIEEYKNISNTEITVSKRIGIHYAKNWKDKNFRFYISNSPCVSKK